MISGPLERESACMEHYYALIMAGGGGTRLWPMSRQDRPKQLLPLVEDDSMFKVSVTRLAPLFAPEQIYVVTGRRYLPAFRADAPDIPEQNFVIEPYGRDTAPAAALGLSVIYQRDPKATVAIMTADHHIKQKAAFREVLAAAYELAQQGRIVTLGITPSYAATGFGYIRQGKALTTVGGFACYESLGFTEKPDAATAAAFLETGAYSWNSGMFIWRAEQALAEYKRQQPAMYDHFASLRAAIDTPGFEAHLEALWGEVTRISLDFAIMEHAQNVAVIPVEIGWNDIGSWAALYEVLKADRNGNRYKGKAAESVSVDTHDTLIYSDKLTVTIGVDDIIVIETPDALLICHKDRTQDVKDVVNHLLTTKNYKYL